MHDVVGHRVPLWDARTMVEGSALYTGDIKLPRMLQCGLRRADVPHAKVINVDVTKAQQVAGVAAIMTDDTAPGTSRRRFGRSVFDRQIFAGDKVRCVSDVLAAVAGESDEVVSEAVSLIEVEYEELEPVLSFEDALAPGAPIVHEDKRDYGAPDFMVPHLVRDGGNLVTEFLLDRGDVESARQRSAVVRTRTFRTQRMEHYSMEPHAAMASFDGAASVLTIWSSTGKPWRLLGDLATVLDLPMSSVRLIIPKVGGDFGGKGELTIEPYCGLLSMLTRRPVRGVFTREEEFTASTYKTPFQIDLTMGLDAAGLIQFIESDIRCDTGAYDGFASMVQLHGALHLQGPYSVENLRVRGRVAYTNNVASGSFRGFGAPQVSFARESLLDELASLVDVQPFEVRRRNAWREGAVTCTGQILDGARHSVSVLETIEAAERAAEERREALEEGGNPASGSPRVRRGLGVATGHHGIGGGIWAGADMASVILRMTPDGGVVATLGVCDVGQGASTTIRQLIAERLGLEPSAIKLNSERDTTVIPYEGGASASRQMFTTGNAALAAASQLRDDLARLGAELFEIDPADLEFATGSVVVKGSPERRATFEQVVRFGLRTSGEQPLAVGRFMSPVERLSPDLYGACYQTFDYVTQVAQVAVDSETGRVTIEWLLTVQDVGKAINPTIIEGQIEGAAVQGIGFALLEDMHAEGGWITNPHAFDYHIPRFRDVPALEAKVLEHPNPRGPFGAKGAGEAAIIAVAPAVANAIAAAVGVRLGDLPMTAERIAVALEAAGDDATTGPAQPTVQASS